MKKTLLSFATALCSFAAFAQPTLTAATNTPVAGDNFNGRICDTTGVTPGAAGAGVTWNFSTLHATSQDTITYMACASTPHCDSFATSNLASFDNANYQYYLNSASTMTGIGQVDAAGTSYVHLTNYLDQMFYPCTYNSTHVDTAGGHFTISGTDVALRILDSFKADGYGTLTLPTGTRTNVLRVHMITYTTDTITVFGFPVVSNDRTESYLWFDTGYHSPLLNIGLDTVGNVPLHVTSVKFYTHGAVLGTNTLTTDNSTMEVFPNPATENITVKFNAATSGNLSVILTDMVGREVVAAAQITNNSATIPVAGLSSGLYLVQVINGNERTTRKVVVGK